MASDVSQPASELVIPPPEELGFDFLATKARYQRERDKRMRSDGIDQYVAVKGEFARYDEDPYVEGRLERAPLDEEIDALVVGGGFAGLMAAARLRDAGIEKLRIIESAGDFGGTWYWNRYPGVQCDVESYIYMPLLEELGYIPTEKYAHGPEILAHAQRIGRHYRLYDVACFQTHVAGLEWDEARHRWTVRTDRDDTFHARFVILANGPLNRPKLPGIPGVETFEGHAFHTSRWDYDYTGGAYAAVDDEGALDKLANKRVGVIGTGATAIQCIPHLGASAESLYVFQRTPSAVDVRGNRPTDPEFEKTLEPGWQYRRMENFTNIVGGVPEPEDLVGDGWTAVFRIVMASLQDADVATLTPEQIALNVEIADMTKMEEIRHRIDSIVEDPATAEALKPWYRQFCKRPCFHDEYLQTYNRPNVHLVDTNGRGVERITKTGVVVDGEEIELDCLVFATGFEVGTSFWRRAGYDLVGRDGIKLSTKWKDGVETFHGFHTRGFPNCFFMMGLQSGLTPNIPHALNEQALYLAHVIRETLDRGFETVETSVEAERDWVAHFRSNASFSSEFFATCTPGYYNNEGKPGEGDGWLAGFYPEGFTALFQLYKAWRETGELEGLELA
jgi:cation diffusion facilitator CzcD-associated flavoprotein CzcO